MSSPIPQPTASDHEDVSWALSTAEANWKRGDHADALRWLQRAAESASEAGLDTRYLELAKAASELAGRIESAPRLSGPPPIPVQTGHTKQMSAVVDRRSSGAPPLPARTSSLPPKPTGPRGLTQAAPRISTVPVRGGAPGIAVPRTGQNATASQPPPARKPEEKKKRASKHDIKPGKPERPMISNLVRPVESEDMTLISPPSAAPPATEAQPELSGHAEPLLVDDRDLEPWPTKTSAKADAPRLGAAARSKRPPAPVDNDATLIPNPDMPRPMQAMRVVLTKTDDGVRISLPGRNLEPMSIEALIVALDTTTDLAFWLK